MTLEYNISTNENARIALYDMLGQEIFNNSLQAGKHLLNIHTDLSNGIYIYNIISADKGVLKTGKVVIIR